MAATKILLGVASLALLTIVPWSSAAVPSVFGKVPSVPPMSPIPSKLSVPAIPSLPKMPSVPAIPPVPTLSSIPTMPSVPTMPSFPPVPLIPSIPDVPDLNFDLIQKRALAFYETLPQTILDDAKMMVPELIKKCGYPCETHKMTTSDGYILTMHRIPYGRTGPSENRPVVYVQQGILSSSADWIIPGPEKGLGYILADAGYDVWMWCGCQMHVELDIPAVTLVLIPTGPNFGTLVGTKLPFTM